MSRNQIYNILIQLGMTTHDTVGNTRFGRNRPDRSGARTVFFFNEFALLLFRGNTHTHTVHTPGRTEKRRKPVNAISKVYRHDVVAIRPALLSNSQTLAIRTRVVRTALYDSITRVTRHFGKILPE